MKYMKIIFGFLIIVFLSIVYIILQAVDEMKL